MDREIAALAGRQHGIVSLAQLRALGLSASAARGRVAAGRLHRVHREVFAVGHSLVAREGRWMAAVLACGSGAVLSRKAAAALWDLRSWSGSPEVLVPAGARRSCPGVVIRSCALTGAEIDCVRGIPCTSVERTLLDLATVLHPGQLDRAIERAELLRLLDVRTIGVLLRRRRGCRGVARLRLALELYEPDLLFTRSELEREFARLCRTAGLRPPVINGIVEAGGVALEIDFSWPDRRVAVEADGFETHRTRAAFERDRRRDQLLAAAGWVVIRCTWRQVSSNSADLCRALRDALQRTGR